MALALMAKLIMIVALLLNKYTAISYEIPTQPIKPQIPTHQPTANTNTYDFYKLVVQWPKSFCTDKNVNCRNVNLLRNEFGIHGLWPERIDGTHPAFHSTDPFEESKTANLNSKLLAKWYDAKDVTSDTAAKSLWKHEWDFHGKRSNLKQLAYFTRTLLLFDQINNTYYSVRNKYQPGTLFSLNQFKNEFQNLGIPEIRCINRNKLFEMRFNITLGFAFTTAVVQDRGTCSGKVMLQN